MTEFEDLKVYIAGHTGLMGSALIRRLARLGTVRIIKATRGELDLTDSKAVECFLQQVRPDIVIIAAGKVGGILANSLYPVEYIHENIMIETNLIHSAWKTGVKRLLNFGSACMYPKHCRQPMSPDLLMTGKLEPTSEPYAIAKLAGLCLCSSYNRQYRTSYITAIPCNLYGPDDTFDPTSAHLIPALIQKFYRARADREKKVVLWGDGSAKREFLHVDDLADACLAVMQNLEFKDVGELINVGTGKDKRISEIAELVRETAGFDGSIRFDPSKPDGTPRKLMDVGKLTGLGWTHKISFEEGLRRTFEWYTASREPQRHPAS